MNREKLIGAGRSFYGIGIAGLGVQQFIYAIILPVIAPEWPAFIHAPVWAYLSGAGLLLAGIVITVSKNGERTALLLGSILLLLFVALHTPFQLFISPYSFHLGLWTNALKELALSGGAFVMAGLYAVKHPDGRNTFPFALLQKLIPAGKLFFCITMVSFGIDHFLYTGAVAGLVPSWIPGHIFWTYFAAIALIGSGVAIAFNLRVQTVALLLGSMLLLWVLLLHIPRAIAHPALDNGNEVTSVFEALAFSGIAFVIGCVHNKTKGAA